MRQWYVGLMEVRSKEPPSHERKLSTQELSPVTPPIKDGLQQFRDGCDERRAISWRAFFSEEFAGNVLK